MKTLRFLLVFSILIAGCNSDKSLEPMEKKIEIAPPTQNAEFDLIGFENQNIQTFELNLTKPNYLIVSTQNPRGIYLTSNYGKSWNLVNDELCVSALKFSYSNPEILILGNVPSCSKNYINALVFKSNNYGNSFIKLDSTLRTWPMPKPLKIEVDPYNPEIFYVHLGTLIPNESRDIIISNNGGKNINHLFEMSSDYNQTDVQDVLDICVNSTLSGSFLTLGLLGDGKTKLLISTNYGMNWTVREIISNSFAKKIASNSNLITIIGNDFLMISNDFGKTFTTINNLNFEYSYFDEVMVTRDNKIFLTNQDFNTKKTLIYYSSDLGKTWKKLSSNEEYKYNLRYDDKNGFLYMIKQGEKSGLFRYKL